VNALRSLMDIMDSLGEPAPASTPHPIRRQVVTVDPGRLSLRPIRTRPPVPILRASRAFPRSPEQPCLWARLSQRRSPFAGGTAIDNVTVSDGMRVEAGAGSPRLSMMSIRDRKRSRPLRQVSGLFLVIFSPRFAAGR